MRVQMLDGQKIMTVNDAYGMRLIEQGKAVHCRKAEKQKSAKATKAADAE